MLKVMDWVWTEVKPELWRSAEALATAQDPL